MDMDKYRDMFLAETREHLQRMGELLTALESGPAERDTIDALFRGAHSIKGMAASMGYERTTELAHHLEDFLAAFRSGAAVTPVAVDRLLAGVDLLGALLDDLAAGRPERTVAAFVAGDRDAPPEASAPVAEAAGPVPLERRDDRERAVRVPTALLDQFIDLTGELLTSRYRLQAVVGDAAGPELQEHFTGLGRLIGELHQRIVQVRMMPLVNITGRLPRLVRDLERRTGKRIALHVSGAEVELDRVLLEALVDPVIHLVRNAVDHGIDGEGTVTVSAVREKDQVLLEVRDDGRGLDPAAIRRKALERELLTPEQARSLADADLFHLICVPGFSTAAAVTETSGRGVGMDVVKSTVERLGGSLQIVSAAGAGTAFQLRLPLSLAIVRVLLVESAGRVLALPLTRVERTLQLERGELLTWRGRKGVWFEEQQLPLLSLRKLLRLPRQPHSGPIPVVVSLVRGRPVGLVVDRLLGQREIFVKPVVFPLDRIPGLAGASLLDDGRIVFVVDPHALLESAVVERGEPLSAQPFTGVDGAAPGLCCRAATEQAAAALAALLGAPVAIREKGSAPLDRDRMAKDLAAAAGAVIALEIGGALRGTLVLSLSAANAARLVTQLVGRLPEEPERDALSASALKEVANILASAYLSALGEALGMQLLPSIPRLAWGTSGAPGEPLLGAGEPPAAGGLLVTTELVAEAAGGALCAELRVLIDGPSLALFSPSAAGHGGPAGSARPR